MQSRCPTGGLLQPGSLTCLLHLLLLPTSAAAREPLSLCRLTDATTRTLLSSGWKQWRRERGEREVQSEERSRSLGVTSERRGDLTDVSCEGRVESRAELRLFISLSLFFLSETASSTAPLAQSARHSSLAATVTLTLSRSLTRALSLSPSVSGIS